MTKPLTREDAEYIRAIAEKHRSHLREHPVNYRTPPTLYEYGRICGDAAKRVAERVRKGELESLKVR